MRIISASELEDALDYPSPVERLRAVLRSDVGAPARRHYTLPDDRGAASTPPVMPAWPGRRLIGVKIVTVMPDNAERGLTTVMGGYMMLEEQPGARSR